MFLSIKQNLPRIIAVHPKDRSSSLLLWRLGLKKYIRLFFLLLFRGLTLSIAFNAGLRLRVHEIRLEETGDFPDIGGLEFFWVEGGVDLKIEV